MEVVLEESEQPPGVRDNPRDLRIHFSVLFVLSVVEWFLLTAEIAEITEDGV